MVELEGRRRVAGDGVIPAARIPGPGDSSVGEAIADSRRELRRHPLLDRRIGLERRVERLHVVDAVAVGRDVAVTLQPDQGSAAVEDRLGDLVGRRARPERGHGRDEPDVVEHGAAPGGGEEVVAEGVLAGIGIERQLLGVEVPQREPASVTPDDVAVHAAAIHLELVLVEAMGWGRIDVTQRYVVLDQERLVRQIGRESGVDGGRIRPGVHDWRQRGVRNPVCICLGDAAHPARGVHLRLGRARRGGRRGDSRERSRPGDRWGPFRGGRSHRPSQEPLPAWPDPALGRRSASSARGRLRAIPRRAARRARHLGAIACGQAPSAACLNRSCFIGSPLRTAIACLR